MALLVKTFKGMSQGLKDELENNILYSSVNIVGKNTYPNFMGLLSGIHVEGVASTNLSSEDANYQKIDSGFFDNYPLIWFDYEKNGYVTGFQVSNLYS